MKIKRNKLKRSIYYTPTERQAIQARADQAGVRLNAFLILSALGSKVVSDQTRARVFGELGRIGNNLNQLARHLNGGGKADDRKAREELRALLLEVRGAFL